MLLARQLRRKAEWHARRFTLMVAGVALLALGGGFLVAALWQALAAHFSPLAATLVCAALFIGGGLVVLALRDARPEPELPPPADAAGAEPGADDGAPPGGAFPAGAARYPALFEAFLFGLAAYERLRQEQERR